ncbi:MAG: hypothetical protein F6K11_28060 [Leptolyngbya sp. SIO3F4]|nr:hypothetical protein [Leptolyngbya sp. SIO3F4]
MASSPDNTPAAIPPRPGSGPETEINPQLENVLRNLNVNLENELTRYRRQRHGRVPPPPPPRRTRQGKTLDLISVSAAPSKPTPVAPTQPPPPPPNPLLTQQTTAPGVETDVELPDLEQLSQEANAIAAAQNEVESDFGGNEVALPVPSSDTPTEGYLESSEELLKSIADEQTEPASVPEPYSPERKNNSLLKLAGLVLVLLGGIGVGFAITYPSQLQNLRSQIWPTSESTDTANPETSETISEASTELPDAAEPPATEPVTSPDGYKPPGPDLSTQEFKELDNVQDLVTLDVEGSTGTTIPPTLSNPAQTPIPAPNSTPGQAAVAPNPETSAASEATSPTQEIPTATPATPAAPTTTTAPAPTGSNYYVITSYTGDASLTKARELVPDAFVRNFQAGARIQLAAFDNRAQAEDQVAALTQQGATVELFGPTNE